MYIDPAWPEMLIKTINKHFDYHLREQEGLILVFADQDHPDYEQMDKWLELSFFGPLFDDNGSVRSVHAIVKVHIRIFIKAPETIYEIRQIEGLAAAAASKAIRLSEIDRCFNNLGINILPKGKISTPKAGVASEVTVTYGIQLKE